MAHDELLRTQPPGVIHACHLCNDTTVENAKEAASVTDTGATFTEKQHLALLANAVATETSSLTAEKATLESTVETLTSEKAEMSADLEKANARVDVLEAELASAKADVETARREFEDFKASIDRAREVAELRNTRVAAVKAANANLPEEFFSEERINRWAEMAAESFDDLVASVAAIPSAAKPTDEREQAKETAALSGGVTPTAKKESASFISLLGARRGITPEKEA